MKKEVVLVFQKNAILGQVKTRLASGMGELRCLGDLQASRSAYLFGLGRMCQCLFGLFFQTLSQNPPTQL